MMVQTKDILYLSFHNFVMKKHGLQEPVKTKTVFTYLAKHFLVPKPLRYEVIRECELKGLLRRKGSQHVVLVKPKYPFDNFLSPLIYKTVFPQK